MGSLTGITPEQVADTFRRLLPKGTPIVILPHRAYMEWAKTQEFVKHLIQTGIYTEESIDQEFIHPAACINGRIMVDAEQISRLMEGVHRNEAFGYAANVALHEYHHLQMHTSGARQTLTGILDQEMECAEHMAKNHPLIVGLAEKAEAASPTISAVTQRMKEGFDKALGG